MRVEICSSIIIYDNITMDLTNYPLEDWFLTNLAQLWDGATGTMYLNTVPTLTFPSWVTTYLVIEPGTTNMQIAEIDSIDSVAKTVNVVNVTLEKGAWISSSALSHSVNSKVIISDNYQFWLDIATAINSKLDDDMDWNWDAATDFGWAVMKSLTTAQRTGLTATNWMIVYDTTIGELYQYIGWAWSAISAWSTQPNASETVAGKVELPTDAEVTAKTATGWTWASLTPTNAQIGKSVALKAVDATLAETDHLPFDNAWTDNKMLVSVFRDQLAASETAKGTAEIATQTEADAWVDDARYLTPLKWKLALWLLEAWTDNTYLEANTERTSSSDSFVKVKEFTVNRTGEYRISFDLKGSDTFNVVQAAIYRNGSLYWTGRALQSTSYSTFTEDLEVTKDDLIQLYYKGETPTNAVVRNFNMKYDLTSGVTAWVVDID